MNEQKEAHERLSKAKQQSNMLGKTQEHEAAFRVYGREEVFAGFKTSILIKRMRQWGLATTWARILRILVWTMTPMLRA
jgi:hypothetical protein